MDDQAIKRRFFFPGWQSESSAAKLDEGLNVTQHPGPGQTQNPAMINLKGPSTRAQAKTTT